MYMDKDWLLGASGNDTTLGMYIHGANVPIPSIFFAWRHGLGQESSQKSAAVIALLFTFEMEC